MNEPKTDTPSAIPPRPTRRDPNVRRAAAEKLADKIARWMGDDLDERRIAKLAEMHWPRDGYEFARDLESWMPITPDFELVEILHHADLSDTVDEAVAAWVAQYGITLDLPNGARCILEGQHGFINGRDDKHATYYFVPDDERAAFENGSGGYLVTPDQITPEQE